jgi:hypothetical protein
MATRTLIEGGTVITVDRAHTDFTEGDAQVEDGVIEA